MIRIRAFVVVLLFSLCSVVFAQEVEKSNKTEVIGNTEYYLHTVSIGQTIYGISKGYVVSMDEIINCNPEVKKGLKAGFILKIPVQKSNESKNFISHKVNRGETLYEISFNYNVKVSDILNANPGMTEKIKPGQEIRIPVPEKKKPETVVEKTHGVHVVQKGETVYSIAKHYNTTIDELKNLNPGLTENVQIRQQIRLPLSVTDVISSVGNETVMKDTVIKVDCGKTGLQNSYRIALMIPFYLDKSNNIDTASDKTPVSSYSSLSFIQFYEGVRIAIDSIEKEGVNLTVYVYDVNENTDAETFIRKKPELKNMDLIIGPFFMNNFTVFADWAEQNGINIINPFTKKESIIKNNRHTFKMVPSDSSEAANVISFIADTYPGCNLIIVRRNADSCLQEAFKQNAELLSSDGKKAFSYCIVDYSARGYSGVTEKIQRDTINVIITLAEGEAFVSAYIRNLNETAHKNKIVLFAPSSWEKYPSLDLNYLMNLNMHIFENYFIDYSKSETVDFIRKFRQKYNTDPDYYAFHGYDIMMYFTQALKNFGLSFPECISQYNPRLLSSDYTLRKRASGGYENISCMIYRFDDFSIINALENPQKVINYVVKKKP